MTPALDLFGQVSGGLAAERRVGGTPTLTLQAVARRARSEPARGIAAHPQRRRRAGRPGRGRVVGHRRVIGRHRQTIGLGQLARDPRHRLVQPLSAGVGFELAIHVADVESRQARRARAVTQSVKPVTGHARIGRPGVPAAQRDQLARLTEAVGGCGLHVPAGWERRRAQRRRGRAPVSPRSLHWRREHSLRRIGSGTRGGDRSLIFLGSR